MRKPTRQARILVIDDEPFEVSFLLERLREECASVAVAVDVSDAAEQLSSGPCDLVLLDVMLPGGSKAEYAGVDSLNAGTFLLQELREGKFPGTKRDIPVVVITARADADLRRKMSELGVSSFLEKPVLVSEILQTIKEAE